MARILSTREICERALRKIGAFSINDTAARAEELEEARLWLDMMLGHRAATKRAWWLVPETQAVTLTAAISSYGLKDALAGDPDILAVVGAWAVSTDGSLTRTPLAIARRPEWENRSVTTGGPPALVYIDRTDSPVLQVNPIPAAPIAHTIEVVWQRQPSDLVAANWTTPNRDFREAWNMWVVSALAAELADGPVRKAPGDEVRAMRADARRLLDELEAWDAQEHADEPRRTAYNDF